MSRRTDSLFVAAAGALAYFAVRTAVRNKRRISLKDKTVLITGGSRGLGLLLARQLAAEGAKVAICAREQSELDRATREFAEQGLPFAAFYCDVTDRAAVEQLVGDVEERFGPVDVLINNAGTITVGPFETMTAEDFDEALKLHVWGPLYTSWAVLPSMRERQFGRIVNIASIGGKVPVPHLAPYCTSKFALVGLSECMRGELAKDNILVTTVCPGLIRTGSPRNVGVKGKYKQEYLWFKLGDSIPGASMSAVRAARQVIDAMVHGQAEVILSMPANAAARIHGMAPGLMSEVMALENQYMMPERPERWDSGEGVRKQRGYESESAMTKSVLTGLTEQAAAQNNEIEQEGGARGI